MELDPIKLVTTIGSVLGAIIPAIWYLSTRLQRLQGSFDTHSTKMGEKISNLEQSVCVINKQVMKTHEEMNELRERVVVLETRGERD